MVNQPRQLHWKPVLVPEFVAVNKQPIILEQIKNDHLLTLSACSAVLSNSSILLWHSRWTEHSCQAAGDWLNCFSRKWYLCTDIQQKCTKLWQFFFPFRSCFYKYEHFHQKHSHRREVLLPNFLSFFLFWYADSLQIKSLWLKAVVLLWQGLNIWKWKIILSSSLKKRNQLLCGWVQTSTVQQRKRRVPQKEPTRTI